MVEGRAETINITARTDLALARGGLLGRHVTGRTQWLTRNGEARVSFDSPRQSEIRHTRRVVFVDEDVRGLEIPVQNPAPMRMLDSFGKGPCICSGSLGRQRLMAHK